MNTNPNRNSRHHHQQLPSQGSTAGGGNNNVLVYINQQQQQQQAGVDLGGLDSISQNPNPIPPSAWVKSHSSSHHHQQGNSISNSSNSNCSPASISAGSMSGSYGASSSYNSPQHSFYSTPSRQQQQPTDIRYSTGNNGGANHMRPNPNYNNLTSNSGMFYPVENQSNAESCQYYQQENNFQFDHTQMKSNSCDINNANEGVSSNNSNFYGFYPQNSHTYQQQQDYQNISGASTGNNVGVGDDGDYSRVLHQQQHYHHHQHPQQQQQQHSTVQNQQTHNNSLPVTVQDYFGLPSSSTENPSGRHNPNYSQQMHHQHQNSTPFRRNSIESYSSEPGDLPYNAKYGCNFPSTLFNSQTNSGMTKRDSMSTSSMSMSVPNCNSQWSRDNIVSAPEHCHTTGNSHGYFFNSHSQQNQSHRHFSNVNVNQSNIPSNFHQQQMQSFKSCSFEQQELRLDDDMKPDGQVSTVGTSIKAAAVKHRSLSLSLPASSYSRSDLGFHTHLHEQGNNSLNHSHLNNSNNLNINPFEEIESNSNVVPVPVNQNSDHKSQCKLSNCGSGIEHSIVIDERTSVQCDNFSQNNEPRIQEEIIESQNLVETTTLSSCPSSQSNFSNSEVSNSDSIVSACSNFPEVVTSVLDSPSCTVEVLVRDECGKTDMSLISTTTNDIGNQVDNESETDPNNSSSSCGLGLFGHSNSVSNLTLIVGDSDDSESCMSGISSFSGSNNHKNSPQKISKRSFSEADKDLVINTTAVSFAGSRGTVAIPKGWKRESTSSQQTENIIFYISPSGTKLRTWDELKNYICSDGTCKCGLSCPLRLEQAFSFDPKVTNLCQEEEESLLNINETGTESRLLCNHKRKIPKSEDSPLISSTRDDLGDCGEKTSKKRRTSGNGPLNENLTSVSLPKSSPSVTSGHHVPVPFSQQSPDTTTQTPQTDMSPASSVSSETSSATIFSSTGGNGGSRSTNSTPTPTSTASSSRNVSTPPAKGQAQCGFAWPPPPSSQPQTTPFWSNTINNANASNNSGSNTTTSTKKNSNTPVRKPGYQHHLIPKVVKRSASPCPNIDVRQIPLEQNRPPPRQTPISIRNAATAGASHPNQNPNLSFFPVTSSNGDEHNLNMSMNMNTGYSISPIPNTTNNTTIVNANLINTNANSLPMQIQRVITGQTPSQPTNALLPQTLPSSITISMVGQQPPQHQQPLQQPLQLLQVQQQPQLQQQQQQQQLQPKQQPTVTKVNTTFATGQNVNVTTTSETRSEKSPLQLVQDVVNRFHSNPKADEGSSAAAKEVSNGPAESSNKKAEQVSGTSSSPVTASSTSNEPSNEVEQSELETQIPASSSNVTSTNTKTKADDDITIIAANIGNKTNGAVSIVEVTNSNEAKPVTLSPMMSTHSRVIVSGIPFLSSAPTLTTTTSSAGAVPIMTAMCAPMVSTTGNTIINCATTTTTSNANTLTLNALSNLSALSATGTNQPLILQQSTDQTNGQNQTFLTATSAGPQSLRYPIFQTIQPFFLNSTGAPGGSLIISPQSQPHQAETIGQQSFIYDQSHTQHQTTADGIQPMLQQTTMVLDPNVCGNTGGMAGGPKKKKKRLSKKQQQQQAQLQLQQQLILQQLHHQAQQQQAAQTIPLTIFPQSFNLGPQGFSLQPMNTMNFFQTPTILTLPNLILNPADGTLFIQPQLSTTPQQTVKLGQFPLAPQQTTQQPNLIAPKKDNIITTSASTTTILSSDLLKTSPNSGDVGSDDSRQNATPDSSTNDLQLSLSMAHPNQQNSITLSIQPHTTIGTTTSQKKIAVKSKAVSSSSSAVKRVFTQKQILPKIDSTTPSVENG